VSGRAVISPSVRDNDSRVLMILSTFLLLPANAKVDWLRAMQIGLSYTLVRTTSPALPTCRDSLFETPHFSSPLYRIFTIPEWFMVMERRAVFAELRDMLIVIGCL
jgi:hypothetical protein